ncbi:hypothetical protein GJAV_G00212340 [Gymnothorax javanicus]|nr:hypothetical protein GJAV_G00212340 [Gymnothorax javanicus]
MLSPLSSAFKFIVQSRKRLPICQAQATPPTKQRRSIGKPFLFYSFLQFLRQLGLQASWQFGDVYGLDPELLSLVPRPVCAVLLLFPVTDKYESFRIEEEAKIKAQGQAVNADVYFMRQTIGNACGTIGLIHAVANNQARLEFEPNSALKKFLEESKSMSPEDKAAFLEKDESIRVTHESSAQEGQTEAPSLDEKVDLHFIAFVNVGGSLYELDGRKPFPIAHGKTTEESFLEDATKVCRRFMARDPDELRFTVFHIRSAGKDCLHDLGMEWREQSTVSCEAAFLEAQRWVEEVTKKRFGCNSFRSALENGVLLCDLINRLKPGIVKRVNRLSTPIAGLDNINVFLRACGKLGLNEAQLFHPGDLQDLSTRVTIRPEETNRRLKNVLITIYWLGRKAQADPIYNGPHLNLKAFEGLLGVALSKALTDSAPPRVCVRDSGYSDSWYTDREEPFLLRSSHRREDSLDSLDSVDSRTLSVCSDNTLKGSSEGCWSDAEADLGFRMSESKEGTLQYRRSLVVEPKAAVQFNQFLPSKDKPASSYVPAPLRKKRAERNEDNRRSWASPLYTEEDGTFTRSKSMSDIPADPEVMRQIRYEELQKLREQAKETEDQWQNDLSKWKSRRRTVNSTIVKKKEEREQIEQLTSAPGSPRRSRTFKEMQEERGPRLHASPTRNSSHSQYSSSEDVPALAAPRRPMERSYTTGSLFSTQNRPASPATPPAEPDNWNSAPSKVSRGRAQSPAKTTTVSAAGAPKSRFPFSRPATEQNSGSSYKRTSVEIKPISAALSASLPRSYQRSDSLRLTSVVTPRPFGTQSTRIASLPRTFATNDSHKRFNGESSLSKKSAAPSRYSQFMTEEEKQAEPSPEQSSEEEGDEEESKEVGTPTPPPSAVSPKPKPESTPDGAPMSEDTQDVFCDMRISLNQKPNSGRDFGFQADWDSTGAFIKSIQEGSPAELCQLSTGDEVLAVSGRKVSEMSYEQWKGSLEAALQKGCLIMDIRRHGKNSSPDKCVNTCQEFAPQPSVDITTKTEESSRKLVDDTASKDMNGGFSEDSVTMRNKGGAESASSDVQASPASSSSNRWSWDLDEERRRQEKWQKEQERLLQEKYRRDQEKMDEEWRLAQQEAMKAESRKQDPASPAPGEEPSSGDEEVEEELRRAEAELQERQRREAEELLRREEEERLRREEELRLRRKRQEEEEERKRREQEERRRQEEEEEQRRRQKAEEEERREEQRRREQQMQEQWAKSKSTPELDEVRKADSKVVNEASWSRDSLRRSGQPLSQAESERQQILQEMKKKTPLLTDGSWIRQRSTSVKEPNRASTGLMRRGESLDNLDTDRPWRPPSWAAGPPSSSRPQSATPSGPTQSGPASSWSYTRPANSTARPWAQNNPPTAPQNQSQEPRSSSSSSSEPKSSTQQRSRSVSGKKMCTFCGSPLGKGAAMIIESLGLCYHLSCFKCMDCKLDLGGSEAGAEVRIRNQQLYCNSCYIRLKSGQSAK